MTDGRDINVLLMQWRINVVNDDIDQWWPVMVVAAVTDDDSDDSDIEQPDDLLTVTDIIKCN